MARGAFVADIFLVSITKVRGGLLWLLSAWSMAQKGAEHYSLLTACSVPPSGYWPPLMCQRKLRSSHFYDSIGPVSLPKTELLFATGHMPAEAQVLAFLCWQRAL